LVCMGRSDKNDSSTPWNSVAPSASYFAEKDVHDDYAWANWKFYWDLHANIHSIRS
jgi:hypothetical protein